MEIKQDWAVLVSQTASELISISKELGFLPSLLVTNNLTKIPQKNLEFLGKNGVTIRTVPFRPTVSNYLTEELMEKKLITLHGYLRILPAEFLQQFKGEIYNGHPGLITEYPELKGKDPQVRAWEGRYKEVGSVVHKVTEGVDEGEVDLVVKVPNTATSLDEMFDLLRTTSLVSWKYFFIRTWKLKGK